MCADALRAQDVFIRVAEENASGGKKPKKLTAPAESQAQYPPVTAEMQRGAEPMATSPASVTLEQEMAEEEGYAQAGYYVNGCLNCYSKVQPVAGSKPPAYDFSFQMHLYTWLVPLPCCCIPQVRYELQPGDGSDGTDDAEIYEGVCCGKPAKHKWVAQGKFSDAGGCGEEEYHRYSASLIGGC